jgi:hypothetical protein
MSGMTSGSGAAAMRPSGEEADPERVQAEAVRRDARVDGDR